MRGYSVCDLKYPLAEQVQGVSKTELAKMRLLSGKPIFKQENNNCNSIEYEDYKFSLVMREYDVLTRYVLIHKRGIVNHGRLKFLSDVLYQLEGSHLYFIVKRKVIVCIFSIRSLSHIDDIKCTETDKHYSISFTSIGNNTIVIDKDTLSFSA